MLGETLRWTSVVEISLVASCYRNQDKLRPDAPLVRMQTYFFTFTVAFVHEAEEKVIHKLNQFAKKKS